MKPKDRIENIVYGLLMLLAGGFMILAIPDRAWSDYYAPRGQVAEFDAFMREHPKAATELQQNPDLVYNRKWLDKHPEFDHFLKGRPELRDAIAHRPGLVFHSNDRYDRRYDRRPFDRFDPRDRHWGWQHR
ncbi:MAG TPA: hypothetical protein VH985_03330 [Candidatus Binatia bacterium]|jgi:hypothetical protein